MNVELRQEEEDDEEEEKQDEKQPKEEQGNNQQNFQPPCKTPKRWVQKNHPPEQIIGDKSAGMETKRRRQVHTPKQVHLSLLSTVEPRIFEEAKNDEHWIKGMEEELSQIEKNGHGNWFQYQSIEM